MSTPVINGHTRVLAHIGYPTHSFKAPQIYNPYFAHADINAVVVPMGCTGENLATLLKSLARLENFVGALITMPHKVSVLRLLDEASATARIAGACNAVKVRDGRLIGDLFDGAGFVSGCRRKGFDPAGRSALVIGCGGVGSAIAASLAAADLSRLRLFDLHPSSAQALAQRLQAAYPGLDIQVGHNDAAEMDLVVNASPLGMNADDPLPTDVSRLGPATLVGEVVMRSAKTAFLAAAQARGCSLQIGVDMLFEQIPAYLAFFDLPVVDAQQLRELAQMAY